MIRRQNYSRKREAILNTLRGTTTHPTAEWVYLQLKSTYPDLSLGTVYRNLSQFKEDGTIISVDVVNGQERFDENTAPHSHFICTSCSAVLDIPDDPSDPFMMEKAACSLGAKVDSCDILFRGTCSACLKKQ